MSIWDEWADEKGDLGPIYGRQWRSWPTPRSLFEYHLDDIEIAGYRYHPRISAPVAV